MASRTPQLIFPMPSWRSRSKRPVSGLGLDLGTGIELARAALTMRHAGIDPAAVFAIALRHFDTDEAEKAGTIFSRFPTVRRFATDLSPKPLPFPKFPSIARSSCSRYWRHEAAVDGWRWRTVTETRSLVAIHSPWRAVRCPRVGAEYGRASSRTCRQCVGGRSWRPRCLRGRRRILARDLRFGGQMPGFRIGGIAAERRGCGSCRRRLIGARRIEWQDTRSVAQNGRGFMNAALD